MHAKHLIVGQQFSIPSCQDSIRNLVCLRISHGSVQVSAEEREGINDSWDGRKSTHIGLETNVVVDETQPILEVSKNSSGQLTVKYDKVSNNNEENQSVSNGKRGRKRVELIFPAGEFTINSVAESNDVSGANVYQKVIAMIQAGAAKVVREERKEGSRGKKTKIYSLIVKE